MNLQRKLEKLGIQNIRKLDDKTVRILAYNVTDTITKTFPVIYEEYNNILIKLLNCDMYVANITKKISKVNYIYENSSIYFDEEVNLSKINEEIIHECIHYLQDFRSQKGELDKIGLCSFEEFNVYGLGINEATVQYMSARCVGNNLSTIEKYGIRIRTISPSYYPFLTNLIEQIVYLLGEDILVNGALKGNGKFEEYLLNTFEGNTKRIISGFDGIVEMNNELNSETDETKIKILQEGIACSYIDTQNTIFSTFFDKIIPKVENVEEIDYYLEKAINYKSVMGIEIKDERGVNTSVDAKIQEINEKLNKRLIAINRSMSRNTLSVIKFGDKIMQFIRKVVAHFAT